MDFADDDLLGDILSDGSNDSFFDDPKRTIKKSKKTPEKVSDKKNTESWLDVGTSSKDMGSSKTESKTKDDWLGLDDSGDFAKGKDSSKLKKPERRISFEDDDILGTLGLKKQEQKTGDSTKETKQPQGTKEKKIDFLESILKPSKKVETIDDILKPNISRSKSGEDTAPVKNTKAEINEPILNASAAREGRRRKVTSGLVDPLGLFSNNESKEFEAQSRSDEMKHNRAHSLSTSNIKDIDTLSSNKSNYGDTSRSAPNLLEPQGLPDWLGGSKSKSSETDWGAASSTKSKSEMTLSDKTENPEPRQVLPPQLPQTDSVLPQTETQFMNSLLAHQKIAQSQMDFQTTSLTLHQQESQIMMALQMKKYEDSLQQIQRQQQDLIAKQEQQFNVLLERQFAKQQAMENNLRIQQERINNHIQLLLSQPRIEEAVQPIKEEIEKAKENAEEEHIKVYESMINNLKQRQREELFILEESYKKQISMLEDATQNTETRLKSELEASLARNQDNIRSMQEAHEKELENFKKKIEDIEREHTKEIKLIRENHMRVIEEIKYEHNIILDNIKESKRSESSMLKEAGDFGHKLDANIELLSNNSKILGNVAGRLETDYGVLYAAREESLRAKEKEIEMMRNTMDKYKESVESERIQLLTLVRNLETKMVDQNHASKEERWALQQAVSTLAARSAAFDRETEYTKASLEREREQLKALKESLLADQEKIILQLTEEKLTISAERSRLETSNKLNLQYDSQKAKAELDAAIQVAREATEMTDREREALQKQICEVESLKRTLQDKERKLASKETELARLSQFAEKKAFDGEKALEEANAIEVKYNERMKHLQFQLLQLSNREKKITEEKIALSKERIALNNLTRGKKLCTLCATERPEPEEPNTDWNNDVIRPEVLQYPRFDVTDAEIFRLQFEDKEENLNNSFKNL